MEKRVVWELWEKCCFNKVLLNQNLRAVVQSCYFHQLWQVMYPLYFSFLTSNRRAWPDSSPRSLETHSTPSTTASLTVQLQIHLDLLCNHFGFQVTHTYTHTHILLWFYSASKFYEVHVSFQINIFVFFIHILKRRIAGSISAIRYGRHTWLLSLEMLLV